MLDNNLDRGTKKWHGLMLPGHVVELRRWQNKEHYEEHPQLDDFDLQAIQHEIEVAQKRECEAQVRLWDKGKSVLFMGVIRDVNVESMWITVNSPFGRDRMPLEDIIDIQCMDNLQ